MASNYIFDPRYFIIEEQTVFASAASGGNAQRRISVDEHSYIMKLSLPYKLNIVGYHDGYVRFDFGIETIRNYIEYKKSKQQFSFGGITNGKALEAAEAVYNQAKLEQHPELGVRSDIALSYEGSIKSAETEYADLFARMEEIYEKLDDNNKKDEVATVERIISEYEANYEAVTGTLANIEAHENLQMKTLIKVKSIYGEVIDLVITTLLSMFGCLFLMTGVIHGSLIPLIFWWIELDMIEKMEGGTGDKGPKRANRKRFFEILCSGSYPLIKNILEHLCQQMNGNPSSMFFPCITGGSVFYICASALLNIFQSGGNYDNLNSVNKSVIPVDQFELVYAEIMQHDELIHLINILSADGNSDIDIKICINKCPETETANYLKIAEELFKKHERESRLPMFSLYYTLLFGPAFGPATAELTDPINDTLYYMPSSEFFAGFESGAYGTTAGFQMSRYQWAERSEVDDANAEFAKLNCKDACESLGIRDVYAQMVQESGLAQFDKLRDEGANPLAIKHCKYCYEKALEKKTTIKRLTQLVSYNVGSYNMMINDPAASGCESRFYMLQKITQVISAHLAITYPITTPEEYYNILIAHASIEMLNSRKIINDKDEEKTSTPVFMLPQIMINLVAIPEIRGIILLSQAANDFSRGFKVNNIIGIVRANPSIGTAITSRDIAANFRKTLRLHAEENELTEKKEPIELGPNTRVSFSTIAKNGIQNKDVADAAEAVDGGEDFTSGGSWRKDQCKMKKTRKPQKRKTKRTNPRKTKQRKHPKQKISKKRSKK